MTCHVALVGAGGAVMLCDSQGSTDVSEMHGLQKMVAGKDFIVGGTGGMDLINAVFEQLMIDIAGVTADNAAKYLFDTIDKLVWPGARHNVEFLLTTETAVHAILPGTFRTARNRGIFSSVGSGASFVFRAFGRDSQLGILIPNNTLPDTFATAETYLDAANESLTVDDELTLGIVSGGRTYLTGDPTVRLNFAPDELKQNWPAASVYFKQIRGIAQTMRGELRTAQQHLSPIRTGELGPANHTEMDVRNASIQALRNDLIVAMGKFMGWYEAIVP